MLKDKSMNHLTRNLVFISLMGIFCMNFSHSQSPVSGKGGQSKKFGLGLVLGEPTGISAKWWLGNDRALDFNLSWGWGWNRWDPYGMAYDDEQCYNNDFFRRNANYCRSKEYIPNDPDWYSNRRFHFHTNYLFHNFDVFTTPEKLALYYGPGVGFTSWNNNSFISVRGIFGITWIGKSAPFDLFLEIAPELILFPYWLGVNPTAGLGARFYF